MGGETLSPSRAVGLGMHLSTVDSLGLWADVEYLGELQRRLKQWMRWENCLRKRHEKICDSYQGEEKA